jgi:hypothetical protein
VGPRADLDDVEKRKFLALPGLELRPLSHPARSNSLCRLCYPGSYKELVNETLRVWKIIVKRQEISPCGSDIFADKRVKLSLRLIN